MPSGRSIKVDDLNAALNRKFGVVYRRPRGVMLRLVRMDGYLAFAMLDTNPVNLSQLLPFQRVSLARAAAGNIDFYLRIDEALQVFALRVFVDFSGFREGCRNPARQR